jgi:hypothetical protein
MQVHTGAPLGQQRGRRRAELLPPDPETLSGSASPYTLTLLPDLTLRLKIPPACETVKETERRRRGTREAPRRRRLKGLIPNIRRRNDRILRMTLSAAWSDHLSPTATSEGVPCPWSRARVTTKNNAPSVAGEQYISDPSDGRSFHFKAPVSRSTAYACPSPAAK